MSSVRRLSTRKILVVSLSVVLVAALAFVVVGSALAPTRTFRGTLKDLLPRAEDLPRWSLNYRPVAESAEMGKAVGEILNFDDAARGFNQREEQFFVRISSNRPLEEFQDAPPVRHFLHRLAIALAAEFYRKERKERKDHIGFKSLRSLRSLR